jgi:NADPH:quinone reductase-like Zn-dependent oxidoreductase
MLMDGAVRMKAIVQDTYGPPDTLVVKEVQRPHPGDDEVLIRVHAAGVDPGVWHLMTGLPYLIRIMGYGLRKPKVAIPGSDVAGRVEVVGKDVRGFHPGDDVFGTCEGSFAEFALAKADQLAPKPAAVSFDEAAVVPTSGFAALQALRDAGEVRPGDKVLIVGATGGVGTFAVQIAKALGAEVTSVGSTAKLGLLRSIGADRVIDYTKEDFAESSERYDLVLDIAGNRPLSHLRRALTRTGTLVIVGGEGGGRWIGGTDRQLRAVFLSPFTPHKLRPLFSTPRKADLESLSELLEERKLTPIIDREFSIDDAAGAMRYLAEGHSLGKSVLSVAAASAEAAPADGQDEGRNAGSLVGAIAGNRETTYGVRGLTSSRASRGSSGRGGAP